MSGTANIHKAGSRATRSDLAYEGIKQRILENRYPPGHHVLERELVETFGMSRTPIREALIRLQKEGLIEVLPRRGMRVVSLSPDDMREIYEVLTFLEMAAVDLLARRAPEAVSLDALESLTRSMDEALAADDLDAWAAADEAFHRELLQECGNRRLAAIAATVTDQAHRARLITLRLRPRPVDSATAHRRVLEAIKVGDADGARRRHYRHRMGVASTLVDVLTHFRLTYL
jgi:DNA-binding GntR family transcriptional regulator